MMELTDMHCHLVPGVDDGAKNLNMARRMMRMEYKDGVRRIIVTPHYRQNMFETPTEEIRKQFIRLQKIAREIGEDLKVELGCEYHSHLGMAQSLVAGVRPTMAGSPYVLVEFSSRHSYRVIKNQVSSLQQEGFRPIVAHIERYPCLVEHIEHIEELSDRGVLLQVNAESILGGEGFSMKWFCRKLLKAELVDFVATDAHNVTTRRPNLGECAAYIEKKYGHKLAKRLFVTNPGMIGPV